MTSNRSRLGLCLVSAGLFSVLLGGSGAFAQNTNTAYGEGALQNDTSNLGGNSAFGFNALFSSRESVNGNTATGYQALYSNTGDGNTATGLLALFHNTDGSFNTATGANAMQSNTSGYWNTADGSGALTMTTTGFENTASGADALVYNSTGSENTASGFDVLYHNTIGYSNTASGVAALRNNNTGYNNTATGVNALFNDSSGYRNTGTGVDALYHTTSGHDNIALGFQAGYNINSGTNNIEIGAIGSSGDSGTIRIGNQGTQTATYVAGIFGTPTTGGDVVVNTSGRLGVLSSSARYKRDIQPLAERSKGLWQLRPVTFRYRQDPTERQYGLIAEEVANVYPELVVRGDKGEVESVQYRELIPLMLNEMQHQQNEIQHQRMTLKELKNQNQILRTALAQQTAVFTARLERLERTSQTKTLASR